MKRATRRSPCPICNKPDWCLVDWPGEAAICPRTPDGSVADLGEAGYLHVWGERLKSGRRPKIPRNLPITGPKTEIEPQKIEGVPWDKLVGEFCRQASEDNLRVQHLSERLGLALSSLWRMNVGLTSKGTWTFPMRNQYREPIGIRIRANNGRKWAYPDSKNGLFIPIGRRANGLLIICEGPTDTAAAISLGLDAIGRPSCTGGVDLVRRYVQDYEDVVIMTDADEDVAASYSWPGAIKLANTLLSSGRRVRITWPPRHKDLRQWVRSGADRDAVLAVCNNANQHVHTEIPRRPKHYYEEEIPDPPS
jgi:hypothetical protein